MSKPGPYGKLRFCPKCGVEGLVRDDLITERRPDIVEYTCRTCFFGFRVGLSQRAQNADLIHKENRKLRIGNNFADNVTPEARAAFEENNPEPWQFKLWRAWRRIRGIEQDTNTYAAHREAIKQQ